MRLVNAQYTRLRLLRQGFLHWDGSLLDKLTYLHVFGHQVILYRDYRQVGPTNMKFRLRVEIDGLGCVRQQESDFGYSQPETLRFLLDTVCEKSVYFYLTGMTKVL